jgi:uncharacterized membrane protein
MFREIQWRTWGKVISWRIILTFVNFTYTYIATGNWKAGLAVAGMAAVFNSLIYWVHERVWNRINWGKTDKETIL